MRRLTQGLQTIHSVHDLDGNRIAEYEYDPSTYATTLLREYIWMDGRAVAVVEGGVIYFIRTDHIGRPVFATDGTGTKIWDVQYLPFGGVHASTETPVTLRFPGQWFQSESGLHQNWMRDYDPTTGRNIQADQLGPVGGASVYGYALQNPGGKSIREYQQQLGLPDHEKVESAQDSDRRFHTTLSVFDNGGLPPMFKVPSVGTVVLSSTFLTPGEFPPTMPNLRLTNWNLETI